MLSLVAAACGDPAGPHSDARPKDEQEEPAAILSRRDTVRAMPGVPVLVPIQFGDVPDSTRQDLRIVVPPIVGECIVRDTYTIECTPRAEAFGEDLLSYELHEPNGRTLRGTVVFAIGTAPDSAAFVTIVRQASVPASPLPARIRYQGANLDHPRIVALRPLVAEVLGAYGALPTALDTARALRDWVARTAVHPYPPFHPDGSTANLGVLPEGATWADVNALYHDRLAGDSNYWTQLFLDGPQMLDRLLGTLDPATGRRADDGMMLHVAPGQYRIRRLSDYRFVLCTYQSHMLIALWAAAGLHGMMIPTIGHDASAVFIPTLGKWVYMDPTYNEEYVVAGGGEPLSPFELLTSSTAGYTDVLVASGEMHPRWDPQPYIAAASHPLASYIGEHPGGFTIIGSQLNNAVTAPFGVPVRHVQIDNAALAADPFFGNEASFARVAPSVAFPDLGVGIAAVDRTDAGALVHLVSSVPGHVRFQRRETGGAWRDCDTVVLIAPGAGRTEFRSLDSTGATGMTAILET